MDAVSNRLWRKGPATLRARILCGVLGAPLVTAVGTALLFANATADSWDAGRIIGLNLPVLGVLCARLRNDRRLRNCENGR